MTLMDLSYDDFDVLRQLIYHNSGIWLGDQKISFLRSRLKGRLRTNNISSHREYYHFLRYDPQGPEEIQQLIDATTVNETWFFREIAPLEAWLGSVYPVIAKKGNGLRIWSAGCASGEEPLTLAMLLFEIMPDAAQRDIEILATDISQTALKHARAGLYSAHSLRHTEQRWVHKYFKPSANGHLQIDEKILRMMRFGFTNLIDQSLPGRIFPVNLIVCRNVIIYFAKASRHAVLENFFNILKPGGYLILGHAESLLYTKTPFEVARVGDTIMYKKPE